MLIPSLEILKDTPLRSFFHLSIILNVRAVPRLRRENHNWRLLKSWKQKVLIHMKPLTIRNITLGEGRPKIIVPIVDRDAQAILDRAAGFVGYQIDLVEWRADFFDRVGDAQAVEQVLKGLRERLPDKLLLFTFRTGQEGGARDISPEDYLELNRHVAESGRADLIDVEIFRENAAENIRVIHAAGARVVGSNHAFHDTPPHSEILYRLRKAQDMGADILKIAVMARSPRDVLTLLAATEEMYTDYADRPLLTMSMGGTGTVSRLAGEIFGSCATFGTIGESSAPGQIPADELAQVLDVIHRSNG